MLVLVVAIFICAVGAYRSWLARPVVQKPGVLVDEEPLQGDLAGEAPLHAGGYDIAPLATYRLRARLLHRRSYTRGRESEISPLDFAVGWGPMSDSSVLDRLEIAQSVRYFTVHWREPPLPEDVVLGHAANMHLIPADETVARALARMREGEIIELDGYLVRASAPDGWSWTSSLTRSDRGAGACELMWVQHARSR